MATSQLLYLVAILCGIIIALLIFIGIRMKRCLKVNKFMDGIKSADPELYKQACRLSGIAECMLLLLAF